MGTILGLRITKLMENCGKTIPNLKIQLKRIKNGKITTFLNGELQHF
jgi:hypothetical protein